MKDYNNLSKVDIRVGEDLFSIMRNAYEVGYDDAMKEARAKEFWNNGYNEGMNDTWELIKDIATACKRGFSYVFEDRIVRKTVEDIVLNIPVNDVFEIVRKNTCNKDDSEWAGYTE